MDANSGIDVVLTHPQFGTVYMHDAYLVKTPKGDYVVGWVQDESQAIPGHDWQPCTMNFPAGCIKSKSGELAYRELEDA